MTQMEFERARATLNRELINMELRLSKEHPLTQNERDWISLRRMRYDIGYGSRAFRQGHIGTLDRAIKRLEKELSDEERRRLLGSDSWKSNSECFKQGKKEAEKNVR